MTSQELKNSILQYAIQGKLVPQNPNDEPASKLIKRIKAEKEQLILEKKIKKDKTLQPITDDEIPFEIPNSWEWVKLLDICKLITDGEHIKPSLINQGIPLLTAKNITENKVCFENIDFISAEDAEKSWKRCNPQINDILVCSRGTIGRNTLVTEDIRFCLMATVILIKPSNLILPKYLNYFIKSFYSQHIMQNMCGSTAVSALYLKDIKELFVTLPPLLEQQRIVEKIEELMPLVEQYGKAEAELKELNNAFPEKIKKSVLQYAIQGKLVPQNPQNEPATVLLEKIKTEKQKLIREKKIKADKPLPAITEEEIPFEIPDNWVWVRLGELGIIQTGTTPSTQNPDYFGNDIPFIKPADISFSGINYYNEGLTLLGSKKSRVVEKNSVLMVCIGGSIGKNYFNDRDVCCNQQINAITPLLASNKYLFYALCSEYFYQSLLSKATGTATPIINKSTWSELIIPLPPLSEQKLIVEKVEEVLSYCDKLK